MHRSEFPLPLTSEKLKSLLPAGSHHTSCVILCIGTDRIIGDCLGPLTGSMLIQKTAASIPVYGTLQDPVHALNLPKKLQYIKKKHPDCLIIAVDASLGSFRDIGTVYVRSGGLQPGAGVHKHLPSAGDIAITGIAAVQSQQPYLALQTARLSVIASMADHISKCILNALI